MKTEQQIKEKIEKYQKELDSLYEIQETNPNIVDNDDVNFLLSSVHLLEWVLK